MGFSFWWIISVAMPSSFLWSGEDSAPDLSQAQTPPPTDMGGGSTDCSLGPPLLPRSIGIFRAYLSPTGRVKPCSLGPAVLQAFRATPWMSLPCPLTAPPASLPPHCLLNIPLQTFCLMSSLCPAGLHPLPIGPAPSPSP